MSSTSSSKSSREGFWPEPVRKNAGKWFLQRLSNLKPQRGAGPFPQNPEALWDSYLLFDREGTWTDTPNGLVSWGFTVMGTRNRLEEDYWSLRKK